MAKELVTPIFIAKVKDGVMDMAPTTKANMKQYIKTLPDGEIWVQVSKKKKRRSNQENAYYWGVIIRYISDYTGMTPDESHEALKLEFLRKSISLARNAQGQITTLRSTASLTTSEFEDYLTKVRAWASTELELNIPLPNEADFSDWY